MADGKAAILARAKELAKRDGFEWQPEFNPPKPGQFELKPVLINDADRQKYLDRAMAELEGEANNA